MSEIAKHMVIITSTGRTGTRFFGDFLSSMVPGAYSVHEPDVVEGVSRRTWQRIRTFGPYHMLLGRLLGRTGIRNLTQQFISGSLDRHQLVERLRRQRSAYYRSLPGDPIIESYSQWYGILPAVPELFSHYRVVVIVRDPRTWVASCMNFGAPFGPRDLVSRLGFKRLDPITAGDRVYAERWPRMSRFERIAWTWKTINGYLLDFARQDPHTRIYRYESLFLGEDRASQLADLLEFITRFPDRDFPSNFDDTVLQRRHHASTRQAFPDWPDWSDEQARQLFEICGTQMADLGYGGEATWQAKLDGARADADQAPRRAKMKNRLSLSSG